MKLLSEKFPDTFNLLEREKECPFCKSHKVVSELQKTTSTIFFDCLDCGSTGYKNSEEEKWAQKHGNGIYESCY